MLEILVILTLVYLGFLFKQNADRKKKLEEDLYRLDSMLELTDYEIESLKREMEHLIEITYGPINKQKFLNGEIWKYMDISTLRIIKSPDHVLVTETSDTIHHTFFYNEIEGVRKNAKRKYEFEVYLKDNLVVDWSYQYGK